jgi:hypothetical protein
VTTLQLTFIIFVALITQLAMFAAVAFYRQWQSFAELKRRLAEWEGHREGYVPQERGLPLPIKPLWPEFRDFRVQRKVVEDKNGMVCSFYLVPVDGKPLPVFKPGQYLTFQLDLEDPDTHSSKSLVRCYSLSAEPHSEYYRVTIKKVPAGRASGFFHDKVQVGDILKVKAPGGHFYLDTTGTGPIVLIGSGIGITPVLCMLNASLHHTPLREIWLYYGVRNGDEVIMKEHLEALAKQYNNLHLYICYSQPNELEVKGVDYHHAGRIDITLLRLTLPLKPHHFYVCGPKPMMETLVPDLSAWGVPDHHIHYEAFGPASLTKHEKSRSSLGEEATTSTELTVTFSKSGKTFPWKKAAASLLEFAEDHGIAIDSGCRAGSCGTCMTPLEAGEVEYNQSPDADLKPGTCLLCISVPKTNLTLQA